MCQSSQPGFLTALLTIGSPSIPNSRSTSPVYSTYVTPAASTASFHSGSTYATPAASIASSRVGSTASLTVAPKKTTVSIHEFSRSNQLFVLFLVNCQDKFSDLILTNQHISIDL